MTSEKIELMSVRDAVDLVVANFVEVSKLEKQGSVGGGNQKRMDEAYQRMTYAGMFLVTQLLQDVHDIARHLEGIESNTRGGPR